MTLGMVGFRYSVLAIITNAKIKCEWRACSRLRRHVQSPTFSAVRNVDSHSGNHVEQLHSILRTVCCQQLSTLTAASDVLWSTASSYIPLPAAKGRAGQGRAGLRVTRVNDLPGCLSSWPCDGKKTVWSTVSRSEDMSTVSSPRL